MEQNKIKLSTKSMGLKSVLVNEGTVYMTTPGNKKGKRNIAVIDKVIKSDDVKNANNTPQFEVLPKKDDYQISNNRWQKPKEYEKYSVLPATTDKIKNGPARDAIDRKAVLEQRYFGKTFNDNIHIQLIYNIMDIRKIMTVYSNNIIYMLNNMFRADIDKNDVFGDMSLRSNFEEKKYNEKMYRFPQLAYFGKAFFNIKGQTSELKDPKEIFKIYQMLGTLRNLCTHDKSQSEYNGDYYLSESLLFNIDRWGSDYTDILTGFYKKAVDNMNREFVKNNSAVNFYLLDEIMYPEEKLSNYVDDYYDFTVRKSYKFLGFSLKELRESMLSLNDDKLSEIKDKKYDSVRSKLYQLLDFAIVRYFNSNQKKVDQIVEKLRFASKNDDLKKNIYLEAAKETWEGIKKHISPMLRKMNGKALQDCKKDKSIKSKYNSIKINDFISDKTSDFSKLIYFVTLFLDGKEINDLITTLINKFENIYSFNSVLEELKLDRDYAIDYRLFSNAGEIADELKTINSFCRMQKALPEAKKQMYREAVCLLGYNDDKIDEYIDNLLCLKEKEATVLLSDAKENHENVLAIAKAFGAYLPPEFKKNEYDKAVKSLLKHFRDAKEVEKTDKTVTKRMNVKINAKTGFRNFIASNIIESSRFQYLIRYANPKTVRQFAKNTKLVKFVLNDIPDTQIERYYKSCTGRPTNSLSKNDMINYLSDIIAKVDYSQFENIDQSANVDMYINDRIFDERKKASAKKKSECIAVISLYLTVLYLVTKNLVYVNSRYVMAFSILDRDSSLYGITVETGKDKDTNFLSLTSDIFTKEDENEKGLLKKRPRTYIKTDLENTDESTIKQFRNKVCHLNTVQLAPQYIGEIREINSYYGIYHYCLQRILLENENCKKTNDLYRESIEQYHTYNKDYVKAICSPFGYNLPRFKNLSIEGLFDKNKTDDNGKNVNKEIAPKKTKRPNVDFTD